MINIFCAILLGPWYGVGSAFIASFIRNMLGLGSLFAFPGSMCGALLAGLLYKYTNQRFSAYAGEIVGTALIGGTIFAIIIVEAIAKAGLLSQMKALI